MGSSAACDFYFVWDLEARGRCSRWGITHPSLLISHRLEYCSGGQSKSSHQSPLICNSWIRKCQSFAHRDLPGVRILEVTRLPPGDLPNCGSNPASWRRLLLLRGSSPKQGPTLWMTSAMAVNRLPRPGIFRRGRRLMAASFSPAGSKGVSSSGQSQFLQPQSGLGSSPGLPSVGFS